MRLPGCARLGDQRGCDQSPGRSFRLGCRNEEGHGVLRWTVHGQPAHAQRHLLGPSTDGRRRAFVHGTCGNFQRKHSCIRGEAVAIDGATELTTATVCRVDFLGLMSAVLPAARCSGNCNNRAAIAAERIGCPQAVSSILPLICGNTVANAC